MKCPHCLVEIHDSAGNKLIGRDNEFSYWIVHRICPSCERIILDLVQADILAMSIGLLEQYVSSISNVYPKSICRNPLTPEVPKDLSEDYNEACLVLADSPKASAALSRRCLQHLLRKYARVKPSDLGKEIQEVLDGNVLPSHLSESLDAIRNIGNFAAHPMKSTCSGEILDVEPAEAEWTLDVLESLFDFYFVQPAILRAKRDALNKKLKDAGKPEMK